jgi:hypothetical protein
MLFVLIWRVFSLPSHKGCERQLRPGLEIRNLPNLVLRGSLKGNGPRVKVKVKEVKRHVHFRVIGGLVRVRVIIITRASTRAMAKAKVKAVSQVQRRMPLILARLQLSPPSPIYAIRVSSRLREISMTRF